jgi:hypothetical protein
MAASTVPASIEAFTVASALVASVSQAGVAAVAVGVVSAAAGPICGKTVPIIFFVFLTK